MSVAVLLTQLGGDVGVTNPQMEKMKFVMRALAIIMIPITGSFPSVSNHNVDHKYSNFTAEFW